MPFVLHGTGSLPGGTVRIDASSSSQFVSGLLLSGASYENGLTVAHIGKPVPSMPHIEMTVEMLRAAGVVVDDSGANTWRVEPGPVSPRRRDRRARPVQRHPVPGRRCRHGWQGPYPVVAGEDDPARRRDPMRSCP